MRLRIFIAIAFAAALPIVALAQSTSPYAGQQTRDIKTLSADEVRSYLAGEGLGMAKAGELNHYPGPKHVLAMSGGIGLSSDQRRAISSIAAQMTAAAKPLGREIVDAERVLNRDFASGHIDDERLRAETQHIATLQGRLRDVHLSAHIATRKVLTAAQVSMYDGMRGYGTGAGMDMHGQKM